MKTPFEYDHTAAIALCKQYSDNPELLEKVIQKLEISVGPSTVIPSPWQGKYKALHMLVTVNGLTFPYHGSHNDAQLFEHKLLPYGKEWRTIAKKRKDFRNGLLYSLLCCIKSDFYILYCDPEEMGFNPDSIKDMAKWNEIKEHARKLSQVLKLSSEEIDALPD